MFTENSEKYDICLIRTNYDIINVGTSNGLNPSKICLTDKVSLNVNHVFIGRNLIFSSCKNMEVLVGLQLGTVGGYHQL